MKWEDLIQEEGYLCVTSTVDNPTIKDTRFANVKINAASIASVPLPHMGLIKLPLPFQPVARTTPAASVSCMGAFSGIFRYPLLERGSPEVSTNSELVSFFQNR